MKKQAKKICSFRLSEETRQQLKNMVDAEMSEGEVIEYAINKVYQEYRATHPTLPDIKHGSYSIQ